MDPEDDDLNPDLEPVEDLDPEEDLDPDIDPDAEEPLEPEDDDVDPEPQARQPSRGASRIAALANKAKEAEARAAAAEARIAEAERRNSAEATRVSAQQRQAYLDSLDPDARTDFLVNEVQQNFERKLQAIEFQSQDRSDRTAFESLCARMPQAEKVKDIVEERLAEMRAAGTTAPRETVLRYVLGDLALKNGSRARGRQEKNAAQVRERQAARPANGRGDLSGGNARRTTEAQARNKRLENITI